MRSLTLHIGIQVRFTDPTTGKHFDDNSLKYNIKSMNFDSTGKLTNLTLKNGNAQCTLNVGFLPTFTVQFD